MSAKKIFFLVITVWFLLSCEKDETEKGTLLLLHAFVGVTELDLMGITDNLPIDRTISLTFSRPLDPTSVEGSVVLKNDGQVVSSTIILASQNTTVNIFPAGGLENNETYVIDISAGLKGSGGEKFDALQVSFKTMLGSLIIVSVRIDDQDLNVDDRIKNVPLDAAITISFSVPVSKTSLENSIGLSGPDAPSLQVSLSDDEKTSIITLNDPLGYLSKYTFSVLNNLKGVSGETFSGFTKEFYTTIDETPKFPVISEEDLLTKVQQQTFKYFWDFAHPVSGMARERNTSGDLVTSGGSGFGLMAIIVGIERNFITREQGLERLDKILDFLEAADRFHGAWSHWINGNSGNVIPFSANDNGGDLVETSFLVQGLLTFRQYLSVSEPAEQDLFNRINALWESVEWDWYTREGQDVLYWHWSPDKEWVMNHAIRGYNESLITYVLAASSPKYSIDKDVYTQGWANNGGIVNGNSFYGIDLPVGYDYGGPLFFSHYSFLGLDPRNLSDAYANYWMQNVNHTLINRQHCIVNPKNFVGYSDENWGLTASDDHLGYSAHSPTNDLGVITPSAALSSFPYTPEESMTALKFFYYTLGDRLWGSYGFYDAFNVTESWYATSTLAIDQGPIIIMIENYRTGLLWDLFMSCPEVQSGLTKLGFTY